MAAALAAVAVVSKPADENTEDADAGIPFAVTSLLLLLLLLLFVLLHKNVMLLMLTNESSAKIRRSMR